MTQGILIILKSIWELLEGIIGNLLPQKSSKTITQRKEDSDYEIFYTRKRLG